MPPGLLYSNFGGVSAVNSTLTPQETRCTLEIGNFMTITAKQLRSQPGRIISQAANGQEITITYRGKPSAKIIPIAGRKIHFSEEHENELFGIWKDRKNTENVEQFVRNIRKGKKR
jgi:prevent-host-death family protein